MRFTPLHLAVDGGASVEAVTALLKAGADPNLKDKQGAGALHWAAGRGDPEVVLALLNKGGNVFQARGRWCNCDTRK